MKIYYVYILTNKYNNVFYVGFTDDLYRRVTDHKEKIFPGFTKKYNVNKLVYYEEYDDPEEAKHREKQLKRYRRDWKIDLIEGMNPEWRDLYDDFIGD